VEFTLPEAGAVALSIHNVLGQEVRRLNPGRLGPGAHAVEWDGTDDDGAGVPSGAYFYTVTWSPDGAPAESRTRSMMLIR
jgi:flagellar hook assembly protein FlgD